MFWFLLLIILLAFIFWPVIRAALAVRRMHRQMGDAFRAAQQQGQQSQYNGATGRRKAYDRPVGDYVDFEEVVDHQEVASRSAQQPPIQDGPAESQVIDADWEDVSTK